MTRRQVLLAAMLTALLAASVAPEAVGSNAPSGRTHVARGTGAGSFQPDGWIKLCGLSTGCVLDPRNDPPPHPWFGRDVYNTTGRRQTISTEIDEGEGVRYWITVQNDGTDTQTIAVNGCDGNGTFEVRAVVLGKHRRPKGSAEVVTREYIDGTLTFDLNHNEKRVFTLNIVTHNNKNVTYHCVTVMRSLTDPDFVDAVDAKMTTY